MKPLRILSLANVPKDRNAGAAGAELETILALRELGHEVDDVWSEAVRRRIAHGNLHQLLELPRRYARIVSEALAHKSYDVVHVNQPHGFRAARIVRQRWPACAFIHRSHGFEPRVEEVLAPWYQVYPQERRGQLRRVGSALLRPLLDRHSREIVRWASGHIMCSRQDARFIESCGADPRRVAVLPQSAPDAFLGAVEPMTPKRLQTVLYVGQHAFVKAPMVVAAAMDNVATQHPGASFIWVTGKEHHERVRAMVRPETRARLQLLGWMEQSRLKEIFDRAGIFLFPSFFEGSGKAHLEALSRGLCVVASGVGGMLDTIEDGVSGALAPPGDPAAVARRVLELMHDERSAGRMAEAAARRARELSWRRTALETADFYQRIIELNTKR